jgi:hypothetical protein
MRLFLLIFCLSLTSCAELDHSLKRSADILAPKDIVTGKRLLNPESESAEIKRAESQKDQFLSEAKNNNFAVDTDAALLSHLQEMMIKIAKVSHRPDIPWEVHLIESPDVNAFTIGGGKIFFYRGLFGGLVNSSNDNEIAAVMAHEMAHVTARHAGKKQGLGMAASISKGVRKSTGNELYRASYTTIQEDEADRIGVLYMTLAGYNPNSVSPIWERAHQKDGSDPMAYNFAYDHSLNSDRAHKNSQLAPIAMKYFSGQGIVNEQYKEILNSNELLPRQNVGSDEDNSTGSGFVATLLAALDSYSSHLEAQNEELSRSIKMQQTQFNSEINSAQSAEMLTRVSIQIKDTNNGSRGLFGNLQNLSNQVMTEATITIYYLNSARQPIYSEPIRVDGLFLLPGQAAAWSAYLRNVPGFVSLEAKTTSFH